MYSEIDTLIKSLELPAKVRLLTGATMFTLPSNESIGLHEMRFSDGPTGVRGLKFDGGRPVSLFPNATLLASTWDPNALYEVGGLLAEEDLVWLQSMFEPPRLTLFEKGGHLGSEQIGEVESFLHAPAKWSAAHGGVSAFPSS